MNLPHHFLLALSISTVLVATSTSSSFEPSRDPFSSSLPLESTPQFIVLTFDDSITPLAIDLYSQLAKVRHQDGCPITATWYTSIAASNGGIELTKCELVKSLLRGGHEIATHTYGHTSNPTIEEIEGARRWLSEGCGVPREEIRGFRAPNLHYSQDTFLRLKELGFLYDSSVTDSGDMGSDGGRENFWPYTMDDCGPTAWSCDADRAVPTLLELPMWTMYEAGTENLALIPMDYQGNTYEILDHNFYRRYDVTQGGNRAPMGIFLHAAWLRSHGDSLRQWAEDILAAHNDVYFVTNYQLIQWMSNPVPSLEYNREEFCSDLMPQCLPPPSSEGGCGFGSFDPEFCRCQCRPPYNGRNCLQANAVVGTSSAASPPAISCDTLPQYSIRSYYAGERVVHNENSIYKCMDWLNAGKCKQGGIFEPGIGHAWKEAWDNIGTCTMGKMNTSAAPKESETEVTSSTATTSSASRASTSFSNPHNDTETEKDMSSDVGTESTSAIDKSKSGLRTNINVEQEDNELSEASPACAVTFSIVSAFSIVAP
eukprot:CAMPEP_0113554552 /NCGR_PEP_ID=MMETSP0015_2-20120614/16217_1 /TAXON_ID=2838 /ORGANISM="Odontella" /LENGTH=540 /DNA_ID=CAMNT_0000455715 /DNA_START=107 /DNA_END=1726 /DNA_ORIENTATION=- /assembly_acc=CAM_ASM_000160